MRFLYKNTFSFQTKLSTNRDLTKKLHTKYLTHEQQEILLQCKKGLHTLVSRKKPNQQKKHPPSYFIETENKNLPTGVLQ